MTSKLRWPIFGVIIAVVVNAVMDAVGLSGLSFASLFPLMLFFWAVQRLPRKAMGFAFGSWRHYGLAILQPTLVIGLITAVCFTAGAVDASKVEWASTGSAFLKMVAISFPLAILTEEGFFRGWLFGSLQRAGLSEGKIIAWTAIAFSLWHIPAVSMNTEDALPLAQIPVLLINAITIGAAWGMLRSISGSILVTSLCHAVWNAAVYSLFGFGQTTGALGVSQTYIYSPESGYLGLVVNLVLIVVLWQWWIHRKNQTA